MKKQETLKEAALKLYQYQSENPPYTIITPKAKVEGFIEGAKWQQERSYSEEEVIDLLKALQIHYLTYNERVNIDKWFEKFKKK